MQKRQGIPCVHQRAVPLVWERTLLLREGRALRAAVRGGGDQEKPPPVSQLAGLQVWARHNPKSLSEGSQSDYAHASTVAHQRA